jgi:hypothetical protein
MQPNLGMWDLVAQCEPCSGGSYCEDSAGVAPTDLCDAGFWCQSGMSSPTPSNLAGGDVCPAGHECPAGTITPQQCLPGTYQPNTQQGACLVCPGGYVCNGTGEERSEVHGAPVASLFRSAVTCNPVYD